LLKREVKEDFLENVPEAIFKKISPVEYEVEIIGAEKPFWLVFSEAFHPKWRANVEGEHFMVNGFANGWYITKLGDYKATIYFEPQRVYYFSIGVSVTAFLLATGYLGYKRLRRHSLSR